jgi:hypothetical protein
MVLLDWTRMGKAYCLAGVILKDDTYYVVRPLPGWRQDAPVPNVGWVPEDVNGYSRWQLFELVGGRPADSVPPHLEDTWVSALRPLGRVASPAERRGILQATLRRSGESFFGAPLVMTKATAYLPPGTGRRSLTSILVPANGITFAACWREGTPLPDYRVALHGAGIHFRNLAVKDHFFLERAESASKNLDERVREMSRAVHEMGNEVVVRLGLARAFQATPARQQCPCYVMADGFFSFTDPQP